MKNTFGDVAPDQEPPQNWAEHLFFGLSQQPRERERVAENVFSNQDQVLPYERLIHELWQEGRPEDTAMFLAAAKKYMPEIMERLQIMVLDSLSFKTGSTGMNNPRNAANYTEAFKKELYRKAPIAVAIADTIDLNDGHRTITLLHDHLLDMAGRAYEHIHPSTKDKMLRLAGELAQAYPTIITDHDDRAAKLSAQPA